MSGAPKIEVREGDKCFLVAQGDCEIAEVYVQSDNENGLAESRRLANLFASAADLYAVVSAFEVRQPDGDGNVWLVIKEHNTNGQGAVNLGKADRIIAQVALLLEESRRAALAKVEGSGVDKPVEREVTA